MGRTVVEDFAHYLARAERSSPTITRDRGDLAAFVSWFRDTNRGWADPGPQYPDRSPGF